MPFVVHLIAAPRYVLAALSGFPRMSSTVKDGAMFHNACIFLGETRTMVAKTNGAKRYGTTSPRDEKMNSDGFN